MFVVRAGHIIPHSFSTYPNGPFLDHLHTVFIAHVVWFPARPRSESEEAAVSPCPRSFAALVIASKPNFGNIFPFHTVEDVFSNNRRGDRSQMTVLCLAKFFRSIPGPKCWHPEVARITVLLPAKWTCRDAMLLAASWSRYHDASMKVKVIAGGNGFWMLLNNVKRIKGLLGQRAGNCILEIDKTYRND